MAATISLRPLAFFLHGVACSETVIFNPHHPIEPI